jgi:phosphoglycolate phosphatase
MPEFMSIYCARATQLTRTYPGVRHALTAFRDAGVPQAVCTNKPEAVSRTILEDLGLGEFFEIVIGGDTLEHRKPHPLPLQYCLDALDANASASLLVGDSPVDVATARAVELTVGIVDHGYARQPVETLGADFLINDLAGLPETVAGRFSHEADSI